jgi:hypothetical protein
VLKAEPNASDTRPQGEIVMALVRIARQAELVEGGKLVKVSATL